MDESGRHSVEHEQFCEQCGVSSDLHDGPDSCDHADHKARVIEMFGGGFRG